MKANAAKLLDFLRTSPQFVIPIYQRTYAWTERECRQLWDDILRTGMNDQVAVHFLGSIVYIEKSDATVTTWEPLLVIDGQQRLTTVTLLLAALAKAVGENPPMKGFSASMIRGYFLHNHLEEGDRRYKLLLSQTDRTSLTAIVDDLEQPSEASLRVTENFTLFGKLIADQGGDLLPVCKGLAKLIMVDIKLKRGEDDPQLIFESMNSTGKELSQADLIRNYILMRLEHEAQTRLYDRYWRPMELEFGQEAYGNHFDAFMRHFLTVKTGNIPKQGEVYEAFKVHARLNEVDLEGVEEVVQDIRTYARHYCAIALAKESDPELNAAFQDLRELSVDVAFPLLLELYQDYKDSRLSRDELLECVRLVEAYVFRRAICSIPTNSLNKTFATFGKSLRKEQYSASLKAHFLSLPAYRRFPTDDEFHREIQRKDLYNFTRCSYWLRRLENHTRRMGERVPVDELTIEHILPQNDDLAPQWRTDLGSDWKRIQQEWLHTLGNLTLTAYNSEYSDRPFKTKRDMPHAPEQALRRSPLFLNVGLGDLDAWNEDSIRVRAMHLADRALQVWGAPKLDLETLASLIPRLSVGSYTIQDHPNLSTTAMAPVFEAFRKSVLELNPCVTEEFLKLYVAYKAETNFVDIIPQVRRLLLSVNIPIQDLVDPKGRCVDVTGKGRWGNGKVELSLSTVEDLPYAVGIVRQALEYQLDTPESL